MKQFFNYPHNFLNKDHSEKSEILALIRFHRIQNGTLCEKTFLRGYANNKGADHQRSLISTFVICILDSIICSHATDEILIF